MKNFKPYCRFLSFLKSKLSEKNWKKLGDERVNGFIGIALFFIIFGFVRLIWWGGSDNFAIYTGWDGEYDPKPIMEFVDFSEYNQWISLRTADGVEFFNKYVWGQNIQRNRENVIIRSDEGEYLGGVGIFPTCAGNREMMIILLLMLLIPGPAKPKLWYIPLALLSFYIINCFRLSIVNLSTMLEDPQIFVATHDYTGMAMSVFVFFIWLLWEKKYAEKYRIKCWKSLS